jgi:hypothetical protein
MPEELHWTLYYYSTPLFHHENKQTIALLIIESFVIISGRLTLAPDRRPSTRGVRLPLVHPGSLFSTNHTTFVEASRQRTYAQRNNLLSLLSKILCPAAVASLR